MSTHTVLFLSFCVALAFAVRLEEAYDVPALNSVVDIRTAPGDNSLVFAVQKGGLIVSFNPSNFQGFTEFLDITPLVQSSASEQGLLSLAFHPNYQSNGYIYVYFSASEKSATVLSRFRRASGATEVDSSTELRYFEIQQPFSNHNGGQLHFGTDGYLYISVGDGGSANDPQNNGQNPDTLLGSMLRIDVDNTAAPLNYAIPSDNPFANGGGEPEIYFYGLRNPWRFDIDEDTGLIWIADVGQNRFEEVSIASAAGQNFGWRVMEGCACLQTGCTVEDDFIMPIHSYGRTVGQSITGGYVYRGTGLGSDLQNHYIFGDFVSGRIFAIDVNDVSENCGTDAVQLLDTDLSISTFGLINGDIIVADYSSGVLYRLAPDAVASPAASPSASISQSRSRSASGGASTPTAPNPPSAYNRRVATSSSDRTTTIEWSVDGAYVHFQMTATATGYVAMGFSLDGSMNSGGQGSDIVMGYVNGQGFVNDYWTEAKRQPELDEQQNLFHTAVVQNGNNMVLRFTRLLNSPDSFEDRTLSCSQTYLIWAVSDSRPSNIDSFGYHTARGTFDVANLCLETLPTVSPAPSSTRTAASSSSSTPTRAAASSSSANPVPVSSSSTGTRTPAANGASASRTPVAAAPSASRTPVVDAPSASRTPVANGQSASRTPAGVSASRVAVSASASRSRNVADITTDTESTSNFLSSLDDDSGSNALAMGTQIFMLTIGFAAPVVRKMQKVPFKMIETWIIAKYF